MDIVTAVLILVLGVGLALVSAAPPTQTTRRIGTILGAVVAVVAVVLLVLAVAD